MKKIMLFLFAFICINHALEAKIWYTNWPNMIPNSCVMASGSVVEFDLIFEVTDPTHPYFNNFYLEVDGIKYYLEDFEDNQNGQYTQYTRRIEILHNDQPIVTYSVVNPRIPDIGLFMTYAPESTTKNICFLIPGGGSGNGTIKSNKLAGNSNVDFANKIDKLIISPNPFNNNLKISYVLPNADEIQIDLLDLNGRTIRKLNFVRPPGYHSEYLETFDLVPGVYYCRLTNSLKQNYMKIIKN